MFSWSLSCADKICGIKIVQSFSWSHNCADFLFVESKLCRQEFAWEVKTVQAFFLRGIKSWLCRQNISYGVTTWQKNIICRVKAVHTTICLESKQRRQQNVESTLCRHFLCGVKAVQASFFVESKLCRPIFCVIQTAQTTTCCGVRAAQTSMFGGAEAM